MIQGYGWGVDGYGRRHVCRGTESRVLACVIPGQSIFELIDQLEITREDEMMRYNEAINATLDELTNELAAAGWDSTQAEKHLALAAVVALIAETDPNSLPAAYHDGFAAGEAGDLASDCQHAKDSYDWDAWQFGWNAAN